MAKNPPFVSQGNDNNSHHHHHDHENTSRQHESNNLVRNSLLAGSLSGMISTVVLYPLDVIRTKMQSATTTIHSSSSPWKTVQHTWRHGGIASFYTGIPLPLLAQAVYKGTVFTVNNVTESTILQQKQRQHQPQELSLSDRFISGWMGGAVNAFFFVTPVELVRNQMIAQDHAAAALPKPQQHSSLVFRTSWHVLQYAFRSGNNGLMLLWRGTGVTVLRDAWGCGCFFGTMGWMKQHEFPTLIAGGASGLAFWVASLPLDTVKTWVQSQPLDRPARTARQMVRSVWEREGGDVLGRQLVRGWQVAYGRGIPSAALTMTVYSWIYEQL